MKHQLPITLLTTVTAVCLGLVAGEVWLFQHSRHAATRALATLEQKKHERDWLARQSPSLSPENEAKTAADLAAARQLRADLRAALQDKAAAESQSSTPDKPIDAFFGLADFIEKLRARAEQAQVVLKPDERFGFATYQNEGPVREQIATVHRQRLATQYLVEALLEARPFALLAVQRERPIAVARDAQDRAEDFFELKRSLSLRQSGQVETGAFRLEFTGQTAALRNFLNSLADFRLPVVVRSVEVEPLAAATAATPIVPGSPVPLVRQSLSKYAVTVESVLLADNPVSAAP